MPTPPSPRPEAAALHPTGAVTVTAVVVAHDGDRWLPGLRAALAAQTRAPDVVVGADTSAGDGVGSLASMQDWLGPDQVADLPPRTGFGTAVAGALALAPAPGDWVWLLHDDCAPAPAALERLLEIGRAHV